jgi:lipopolysaccharide export system ATP-binding protein
VEDHVLPRLVADGVAVGEPPGEEWEIVRLQPQYIAELQEGREGVVEDLDETVRILLHGDESAPAEQRIPGSELVPGGSTLSARGLVKAYRKRRVVSDVDIEVSQGEIVGLLGPNGAGKTTTFYMVVGLISPDRGKVFLDEQELTRWPMYKRARAGLGYLAQEPSIFRKLTVEENILAILETLGLKRSERKQRLEKLLDELGLRHLRKAKAYSLSGGERRRLEITRALVAEPKFMLLDEPFAGVDPIAVHDIQQIVAELRHRGIGVIISDHNVEQTLDIVDRAYIMYDGKVRMSGTVAELVWNEEVAEIYFGPTLTARMRERYPRPELVV